ADGIDKDRSDPESAGESGSRGALNADRYNKDQQDKDRDKDKDTNTNRHQSPTPSRLSMGRSEGAKSEGIRSDGGQFDWEDDNPQDKESQGDAVYGFGDQFNEKFMGVDQYGDEIEYDGRASTAHLSNNNLNIGNQNQNQNVGSGQGQGIKNINEKQSVNDVVDESKTPDSQGSKDTKDTNGIGRKKKKIDQEKEKENNKNNNKTKIAERSDSRNSKNSHNNDNKPVSSPNPIPITGSPHADHPTTPGSDHRRQIRHTSKPPLPPQVKQQEKIISDKEKQLTTLYNDNITQVGNNEQRAINAAAGIIQANNTIIDPNDKNNLNTKKGLIIHPAPVVPWQTGDTMNVSIWPNLLGNEDLKKWRQMTGDRERERAKENDRLDQEEELKLLAKYDGMTDEQIDQERERDRELYTNTSIYYKWRRKGGAGIRNPRAVIPLILPTNTTNRGKAKEKEKDKVGTDRGMRIKEYVRSGLQHILLYE
ncbi:MAG: hypothetical protein EZS28_023449, partial [Streblomastix strix]